MRFTSQPHSIDAYKFDGHSTADLPDDFARAILPRNAYRGPAINGPHGLMVLRAGDYLARTNSGEFTVFSQQRMENEYLLEPANPVRAPAPEDTAVIFHGAKGDPDTPAYVEWLGYRFLRDQPVACNDEKALVRIRKNAHFTVVEPHHEEDLAHSGEIIAFVEPLTVPDLAEEIGFDLAKVDLKQGDVDKQDLDSLDTMGGLALEIAEATVAQDDATTTPSVVIDLVAPKKTPVKKPAAAPKKPGGRPRKTA